MRRVKLPWAWAIALATAAVTACVGKIGEGDPEARPGDPNNKPVDTAADLTIGPSPLRRLSRVDLRYFGIDTATTPIGHADYAKGSPLAGLATL